VQPVVAGGATRLYHCTMPAFTPHAAATLAKSLARDAGFDAVGIADARTPWEAGARLADFVAAGRHGTMGWMETTLDRRGHPTAMWDGATSAVMVGLNYGPQTDPLADLAARDRGLISVYARGDDYHDVVKKRLKVLAGEIARQMKVEVKVFVDTAPLMEKPLGARAGLGWQGKHTNLVSRTLGSWLFLGCVLVAAELEPDPGETDHCGTCSACLDICPTQAFPAPYQLDARRCISYLTIEHAGPIPVEFRAAMGNRIYGCDDCLAVCPWNKFASLSASQQLAAREALCLPELAELARLDDPAFRALFAKNPVKRIGLARFLRNVAIAIGNSGDPSLLEALPPLLGHRESVVRGAAVWALARLLPYEDFKARAEAAMGAETDRDVTDEWQAGLGTPAETGTGIPG
jgi:epoxyqueuosine reductase